MKAGAASWILIRAMVLSHAILYFPVNAVWLDSSFPWSKCCWWPLVKDWRGNSTVCVSWFCGLGFLLTLSHIIVQDFSQFCHVYLSFPLSKCCQSWSAKDGHFSGVWFLVWVTVFYHPVSVQSMLFAWIRHFHQASVVDRGQLKMGNSALSVPWFWVAVSFWSILMSFCKFPVNAVWSTKDR